MIEYFSLQYSSSNIASVDFQGISYNAGTTKLERLNVYSELKGLLRVSTVKGS